MQYQKFLSILDRVKQYKIFQSKILRTAMWLYGTYNLAQSLLPKVQALCVHLLWKSNIRKLYGDGWAVVTGGSDGLGRAYAIELAKMGFNIIIIGRRKEKLEETKTILEQYNIQVQTIEFDFDQSNESAYIDLGKQILNIGEIVVLINNVGTFEMHPFDEEKKTQSLININVVAGTFLTQQLVVTMKARHKKSLIMFIGSETGENPHSGYAIQASTKAYVGHLARSLEIEYRGKIDVRLVTPGPIQTNLLQKNISYLDYKSKYFSCTPQEVAYSSLRKVTIQTHIIGTWKHGVLQYLQKKQH